MGLEGLTSGRVGASPSIEEGILVMGGSSVLLIDEMISSPSDMTLTVSVRTRSIHLVKLSAFVRRACERRVLRLEAAVASFRLCSPWWDTKFLISVITLSGITPANLSNRIVGSTDDSSVPVGLFPVGAICTVDPNACGWDPPSHGKL